MARGLGEILHHFISEAEPNQAPSPDVRLEPSEKESADPAVAPQRGRAQLLGCLRERLGDLGLSLRLVGEGMLGADSPIDFVTVDPEGGVQLILVHAQGQDPALVGHALAQRDWVAARLRDWLMLSPDLGIRPERGVGLLLLAPSFSSSVIAAAQALEPDAATLVSYRCTLNGDAMEVALDTPAARSVAGPRRRRSFPPPGPPPPL